MYTVIRFIDKRSSDDRLINLGRELNRRIPGMFVGLDKGGTSFSCSVAKEDQWKKHKIAILRVVRRLRDILRKAKRMRVGVVCDTAIEPEDLKTRDIMTLSVDAGLMNALNASGVDLEFTWYSLRRNK